MSDQRWAASKIDKTGRVRPRPGPHGSVGTGTLTVQPASVTEHVSIYEQDADDAAVFAKTEHAMETAAVLTHLFAATKLSEDRDGAVDARAKRLLDLELYESMVGKPLRDDHLLAGQILTGEMAASLARLTLGVDTILSPSDQLLREAIAATDIRGSAASVDHDDPEMLSRGHQRAARAATDAEIAGHSALCNKAPLLAERTLETAGRLATLLREPIAKCDACKAPALGALIWCGCRQGERHCASCDKVIHLGARDYERRVLINAVPDAASPVLYTLGPNDFVRPPVVAAGAMDEEEETPVVRNIAISHGDIEYVVVPLPTLAVNPCLCSSRHVGHALEWATDTRVIRVHDSRGAFSAGPVSRVSCGACGIPRDLHPTEESFQHVLAPSIVPLTHQQTRSAVTMFDVKSHFAACVSLFSGESAGARSRSIDLGSGSGSTVPEGPLGNVLLLHRALFTTAILALQGDIFSCPVGGAGACRRAGYDGNCKSSNYEGPGPRGFLKLCGGPGPVAIGVEETSALVSVINQSMNLRGHKNVCGSTEVGGSSSTWKAAGGAGRKRPSMAVTFTGHSVCAHLYHKIVTLHQTREDVRQAPIHILLAALLGVQILNLDTACIVFDMMKNQAGLNEQWLEPLAELMLGAGTQLRLELSDESVGPTTTLITTSARASAAPEVSTGGSSSSSSGGGEGGAGGSSSSSSSSGGGDGGAGGSSIISSSSGGGDGGAGGSSIISSSSGGGDGGAGGSSNSSSSGGGDGGAGGSSNSSSCGGGTNGGAGEPFPGVMWTLPALLRRGLPQKHTITTVVPPWHAYAHNCQVSSLRFG